ncbi:MAG: CarD family transcriptional regulator, partial [Patescibacteria group bacterium]
MPNHLVKHQLDILELPIPKEVIKLLQAGRRVQTTGIPEIGAQAVLVNKALKISPRNCLLWLTEDEDHQRRVVSALTALRLEGGRTIRTEITPPVLTELLSNTPLILIINSRNFLTPLPVVKHFSEGIIKLRPGANFTPTDLSRHLVSHGYMAESMVAGPGEFARRGGVLDIFPVGAQYPVRLEFSDQEIISLHLVDHANKAGAEIKNMVVPPARMPARDENTNLFAYLNPKDTLFIATDAEDITDIETSTVLGVLNKFPTLSLRTFGNSQADLHIEIRPAPLYAGQYQRLIADAKSWGKNKVLILSARKKQLTALFKEHKQPLPEVWEIPFNTPISGFKAPAAKLIVLTDREIFPRESPSVRSRGLDTSFLSELKPGDYAVHMDHGIGIFKGMRTEAINGIAKEYFVLEYAEKDRLSVPVELAEKLSKYIGVSHPPLHRLSGSNWYQVTRKVREDTRALAKELVRLYAARELIRISPMQPMLEPERALADSFPFQETPDQERAIEEVYTGMQSERPMDRLVCGDVGFGKTEVA